MDERHGGEHRGDRHHADRHRGDEHQGRRFAAQERQEREAAHAFVAELVRARLADAFADANHAAGVTDLRGTVMRAVELAVARRSRTIEAEHLLLALTERSSGAAAAIMLEFGLDASSLSAALDAERAAALTYAGVEPMDGSRLRSSLDPARIGRMPWGASARDAFLGLRRAAVQYGYGRVRDPCVNLLISILGLELGTVPRALVLAGVDKQALRQRAIAAAGGA